MTITTTTVNDDEISIDDMHKSRTGSIVVRLQLCQGRLDIGRHDVVDGKITERQ